MSQENELGTTPSFFAKHLHITGIETSTAVTSADVTPEVRAMDVFDLPSLDLRAGEGSEEYSFRHGNKVLRLFKSGRSAFDRLFNHHGELLGVAAMLLLFILPFSSLQKDAVIHEGIRAKGGDKVFLYLERTGQVTQIVTFDQPLGLENGDRVRVEILAGSTKNAFYFITSNLQKRILTPVEEVHSERLALSAGERAIFPGSIELVGKNEGEVLNILLCDASLDAGHMPEIINESVGGRLVTPKGCLLKSIRLR